MQTNLTKKLAGYSAMAAAAMAGTAQSADAQVVYTDVNPDVTLSGTGQAFDLDGDGDIDFNMVNYANDANYFINNAGFISNSGGSTYGSFNVAAPLGGGYKIGNSRNFNTKSAGLLYVKYAGTTVGASWDETEAFIGWEVDSAGNTHYGWLRVELTAAGTMILKDFAHEATPGRAILAGATGDVEQSSNGNISGGIYGEVEVNTNITAGLNGDVTCTQLTVNSGATLTVGSGETLTVEGDITNNGTIVVEDGGSLIHTGGLSGSGTYDVIRQGTTDAQTYNYWASPMQSEEVSAIGTTDVYEWDAANDQWVMPQQTDEMIPGQGFISTGAGEVTFSGTINAGTVTYSTANGYDAGTNEFNLLGNPFAAALDVNKFINDNPYLTAVYMWDDDGSGGSDYETSDYVSVNNSGSLTNSDQLVPAAGNASDGYTIASCQGFFAANGSGTAPTSIRFEQDIQDSRKNVFFKKENNEAAADNTGRALLTLKYEDDKKISRTMLAFTEAATESFDNGYDAPRFDADNDNAFGFYSLQGEHKLSIQAFPELSGARSIKVGFNAPTAGDFTFELADDMNLPQGTSVILEDKVTGKMHDLMASGGYEFTTNAALRADDRFIVHFNTTITGVGETVLQDVDVYAAGNELILNTPADLQGTVTVRNVLGQTVASQRFNGNTQIDLNGSTAGVYVVTVEADGAVKTEKVVLR